MTDTLKICKPTRKFAADSLFVVLKKLFSSNKLISEVDLTNTWLSELRKNKNILSDGWYDPPPHGLGALFATEENISRANFPTMRTTEYWPKKNMYLDKQKGFLTVYTSPVDKKSGIIGDFGFSMYLGNNKKIQKHFATVFSINKAIFKEVKVGMPLKDLYKKAEQILKKKGYTNSGWISINDPYKINMGHNVPVLPLKWKKEEIAKKRIFFNAKEKTKITKGMAFTIEPRLKKIGDSSLPTVYFHTICLIDKNGKKELLTNFDKIFKLVGMDYMLK